MPSSHVLDPQRTKGSRIHQLNTYKFWARVVFTNVNDAHRASVIKALPLTRSVAFEGTMMLITLDKSKRLLDDTKATSDEQKTENTAQTGLTPTSSDHAEQTAAKDHPSQPINPSDVKDDAHCSEPALPDAADLMEKADEANDQDLAVKDQAAATSSILDIDAMEMSSDSDIEILNLITPAPSGAQQDTITQQNDCEVEASNLDGAEIPRSDPGPIDDNMEQLVIEDVAPQGPEADPIIECDDQDPTSPASSDDVPIIRQLPRDTASKASSRPKDASRSIDLDIRSLDTLVDEEIEQKDAEDVITNNLEAIDLISDVDERRSGTPSDISSFPVYDMPFALPLDCREQDAAYIKNRLRFKLEKIRAMTQDKKTVLNSS